MNATKPTLCVFCGSRMGADPAHAAAASAIGLGLAARGWSLVYGGGNVGLMGVVADAARQCGAHVTGVIPESLMKREVGHLGLDELHVVPTMHVRKQMMAERADAFVALPGGIGTMEELFEVWTWRQLGYHRRPIGLLNTAGYYDRLVGFLADAVGQDFLGSDCSAQLMVEREAEALLDRIAAAMPARPAPSDLTRT